jgi:hypothetical protein
MLENISEASHWLEAALREDPREERRLQAVVSRLSERSQLAILLRSLLADGRLTEAAAARSYVHPLGFDRYVLASSPRADCELRLHIWWPGKHEIVEDVHNHQFAFASAVVDGFLEMEALERSDDGVAMQEFELTSDGGVATSRFRHVGEAVLACTARSWMSAETVYCMAAPSLHRITGTGEGLTATLLLRGPLVRLGTTVFSTQATERATIVRPTMTPRSFGEGLAAYLETLTSSRGATSLEGVRVR